MAIKSFNRTVEAINTLLDKLDLMPDSPANYKGILTNPSYLPEEPTTGDMYLVQYSDTANTHIANHLYYRKATTWDIIATKGYTPYEIDSMLSALAAADIAMTGYEKSSSSDPLPIATTDTASEAIGKLEQQAGLNKNNILYNTDNGVKNVVNFNTNLPTTTTRGITFTDNHNGTINIDGTSTDADAYVQLYNVNSDNLFGFKIGETVVITSTSNTVPLQIIPKRTGGYGATVFGTKLSPAIYTIPSNFTGFLLRVGVIASGTHVDNEDVGGMICLKSLYDADPTYQPYAMSNAELTAAIQALQAQLNQ